MKGTGNERALIDAIHACQHRGFYDQVRWKFATTLRADGAITNSLRAAFSRAKRNLLSKGEITETLVFPYRLTGAEFIDYATHITSSTEVRERRKILLPIILSRIEQFDFKHSLDALRATEEEIFTRYTWGRMKIKDEDRQEGRRQLTSLLTKIYDCLVPKFSELHASNRLHTSDVETLVGMLISATRRSDFSHGWKEKSFAEMLVVLREHFLDYFPDELFIAIMEYEKILGFYANVFERHRHRAFIDQNLSDFRIFRKFDGHRSVESTTETKKLMDEINKERLLQKVHLEPSDFRFIEREYSCWNSSQLAEFLTKLLRVPDAEVKVLSVTNHSS